MTAKAKLLLFLCIISIFTIVSSVYAAVTTEPMAVQVARNYLKAHVAEYGSWNGTVSPSVGATQVLSYKGVPIGYLVTIVPSGQMVVAYYDDFSPVLYYSTTSGLDASKVDDPKAIESWIIPEIFNNAQMINRISSARAMHGVSSAERYKSEQGAKILSAWQKMSSPTYRAEATSIHSLASTPPKASITSALPTSVAPLLQTTWSQGTAYLPAPYNSDPNSQWYSYNLYTPGEPADQYGNPACPHAPTGCVATAMSQVMKYWQWPDAGVGSNSYQWNGTAYTGTTISASFAHTYDWLDMPSSVMESYESLTDPTYIKQQVAVSRLIADVGISMDMQYACTGSGADPQAAANALMNNFKYGKSVTLIDRGNYTTSNWINVIQSELTAPTPRPVMFSIYNLTATEGHEVVIDGYHTLGGTDQVHINYGWSGTADGYYDITNNWSDVGSGITWSANYQELLIGIQPLPYALTVTDSGNGTITANTGTLSWSGNTGTASYYGGQQVTLTAAPQSGYAFSGWGGNCSGTGTTCLVTISSNANVVTANFAAANSPTASYSASGTAKTTNGIALPGVSVVLSGTKTGSATTDSNGNYSFTGLPNGSYTVTASTAAYTFTPSTVAFSISSANVTGENFAGTQSAYTIDAMAGAGGSITPSGVVSVKKGGTQMYSISPASGYSISSIQVDGYSVGAVGSYTFSNVTTNHTIAVTFASSSHTITATAGPGGSISPAGATAVKLGGNQTYAFIPTTGYSVANVSVDGASVGAVTAYTFLNVTANHTIAVTFKINTYTVTPVIGANGTMTPNQPKTVNANSAVPFTVTPNSGYQASVTGCNGSLVGNTYTTGPVNNNCSVIALFSPITYTIKATVSGSGGTISPSQIVNAGSSADFTIKASPGYAISSVLVDGASVGAVGTYDFNKVSANHTISATFKVNTFTVTGTAGTGGSITSSTQTVNAGGSAQFTIVPAAGYAIENVLGCKGASGNYQTANFNWSNNSYQVSPVTESCSFTAAFVKKSTVFTVTAVAGPGGTVSPASQTVNAGSTAKITMTPNAGYSVGSIGGCSGGLVGNVYQLTPAVGSCTFAATFVKTPASAK